MFMRLKSGMLCLAVLLLSWQLQAAAVSSPVTMLAQVTQSMFKSLDANLKTLRGRGGNRFIHGIVKSKLMPHIDTYRMSASVVGRNYWNHATSAQKRQFIAEFAKMVISTYSGALKSYDRDTLRFYPIGNTYQKSKFVRVRSLLIRRNGQKIPISYNVVLVSGRWKVYDFSIENISIAQNYRSQFSSVLRSKGFAGLLQKMHQHNKNF